MMETVLLVEDDDAVRTSTRRHLAGGGYNVLEARDPDEAIRICSRHKESIDLLLTDIIMPEISGLELFKRVASLRPGIKAILMSGYIDDTLIQTAVPFLQKPFTGETLALEVRKVLDAPPTGP
jgi:two-component system, cell cycle sensor histidine kinase and response regulator CckA